MSMRERRMLQVQQGQPQHGGTGYSVHVCACLMCM